jgi:hypothetical protein
MLLNDGWKIILTFSSLGTLSFFGLTRRLWWRWIGIRKLDRGIVLLLGQPFLIQAKNYYRSAKASIARSWRIEARRGIKG